MKANFCSYFLSLSLFLTPFGLFAHPGDEPHEYPDNHVELRWPKAIPFIPQKEIFEQFNDSSLPKGFVQFEIGVNRRGQPRLGNLIKVQPEGFDASWILEKMNRIEFLPIIRWSISRRTYQYTVFFGEDAWRWQAKYNCYAHIGRNGGETGFGMIPTNLYTAGCAVFDHEGYRVFGVKPAFNHRSVLSHDSVVEFEVILDSNGRVHELGVLGEIEDADFVQHAGAAIYKWYFEWRGGGQEKPVRLVVTIVFGEWQNTQTGTNFKTP